MIPASTTLISANLTRTAVRNSLPRGHRGWAGSSGKSRTQLAGLPNSSLDTRSPRLEMPVQSISPDACRPVGQVDIGSGTRLPGPVSGECRPHPRSPPSLGLSGLLGRSPGLVRPLHGASGGDFSLQTIKSVTIEHVGSEKAIELPKLDKLVREIGEFAMAPAHVFHNINVRHRRLGGPGTHPVARPAQRSGRRIRRTLAAKA